MFERNIGPLEAQLIIQNGKKDGTKTRVRGSGKLAGEGVVSTPEPSGNVPGHDSEVVTSNPLPGISVSQTCNLSENGGSIYMGSGTQNLARDFQSWKHKIYTYFPHDTSQRYKLKTRKRSKVYITYM